MHELRDRVAVVTGAARGIGLAMSRAFAAEGMAVALMDRDGSALEEAVGALNSQGRLAIALPCDVTSPDQMTVAAREIRARLGEVAVLCNNAGIVRVGSCWQQPPSDWSAVFDVNVMGTVNGLRAFLPDMIAHGQPAHVVNTASAGGLIAAPYLASYAASKFAVVGLTEALIAELAQLPNCRIGVSLLCPGIVRTDIYQSERSRRTTTGEAQLVDERTAARFEMIADPDRPGQASPHLVAAAMIDGIRTGEQYITVMGAQVVDQIIDRLTTLERALTKTILVPS